MKIVKINIKVVEKALDSSVSIIECDYYTDDGMRHYCSQTTLTANVIDDINYLLLEELPTRLKILDNKAHKHETTWCTF